MIVSCRVWRVYVGFTFDNIMYSATRCPNFMKYPFFYQFFDITESRAICYFSKFPILLVRDAAILLCKENRFLLPVIEFKHVNDSFRQPVPPQCHNKMGTALFKIGLKVPCLPAIVNHICCARKQHEWGFVHPCASPTGIRRGDVFAGGLVMGEGLNGFYSFVLFAWHHSIRY